MRPLIGLTMLTLVGCGLATPIPNDIPVGGAREPITRQNLLAARAAMPGGLLEPGWLPDGFVLVNADYIEARDQIASVDLAYEGPDRYLHIWQTHTTPEELGQEDPVPKGQPFEGSEWSADPQEGNVVAYSARLEDGRTVSIDSDLDPDSMRRILEALHLRGGEAGAPSR